MTTKDILKQRRIDAYNRTPCNTCGGPKEPGQGRKTCIKCLGGVDVVGKNLSHEEMMRRHGLKRFDLTIETYDQLLEDQGGVCAICSNPPRTKRLAVDHDHDTGEVRGLLCPRCNATLEFWIGHKSKIYEYLSN